MGDLDKKLAKYINFRNGFFIEAGANDGFSQSNTYYLEKILGWRGVLIEPIPELFERCQKERKNSFVFNCALVAKTFKDSSIEIHYAGLMSVVHGSLKDAASRKKHIDQGLKVQNLNQSYSLRVPARTLESILDDIHRERPIDFLSLDVEGYEGDALKGLNLHKYAPKYILVEARSRREIYGLLKSKYDLVEQMSHHDYLYALRTNRSEKRI
ncbi:MAG: FkbM family methyltransferase [Ignavibacteriales bacterium]|nr:FkbM family methyltransferase [Ignavibacteriales bacterium]